MGSGGLVIFASNGANNRQALEVVFEPFEEVKKELLLVPTEARDSLARQKYTEECVGAINEQIKWVCIINLQVFNFKKILSSSCSLEILVANLFVNSFCFFFFLFFFSKRLRLFS